MTDLLTLRRVADRYGIAADFVPFGNGHINETFRSTDGQYVLQRINTEVFRDPAGMMDNVTRTCAFMRERMRERGEDPSGRVLTVLRTRDGASFVREGKGTYRVTLFLDGTVTYENQEKTPGIMREAGHAVGRFERDLQGFPAETLAVAIPDFHNTPKRFRDLLSAADADPFGRVKEAGPELEFAKRVAPRCGTVTEALKRGSVPLAVTHNDTKLNNVLFDRKTGEARCLIDLDTVMPGSRLYDYGDAIRGGACTVPEDWPDPGDVGLDDACYAAFTDGYLSETDTVLTPAEKELLPFSAALMSYECGIRFLADFFLGDVYFRTERPGQNLDRARVQLRMAEVLLEREEELKKRIRGNAG